LRLSFPAAIGFSGGKLAAGAAGTGCARR